MWKRADVGQYAQAGYQSAGFVVPLLIPGITMNTSPTDYVRIRRYQLMRFQGEWYEKVGVWWTAANAAIAFGAMRRASRG
jgi:hypothetical protein